MKASVMMMKTLLLICALGLPRGDCTVETAAAVIQGPEAASLMTCGLHGQAYIAEGALAGYLENGHYLKISCTADTRVRPAIALKRPAAPAARP
jgi:hypothetical protein